LGVSARMTIIYYLVLIAPLIVLFAVSYFPLALLGRWLTRRKLVGPADAYAPFAGALGTAFAFFLYGLLGIDRFAWVSQQVRTQWQSSGYVYEVAQGLFSGGFCALLLVIAAAVPRLAHFPRVTIPVTAIMVSFLTFSFWPVLLSPFI
jgi:hypothetical protein